MRGFRRFVVAGTAAVVAAVVAAGTAVAEPAYAEGLVVSPSGVKVRAHATRDARVVGVLDPWRQVRLACQTAGDWVEGNDIWYRLHDKHGKHGWVSARYVHNYTVVPWC
ncbi:SH3 domain-containing protein [Streptomyces sp. NPDC012888]|uniref:SH3 domain-containing protein n=1 Tax=Streptomyces sp. NPDC012888 TaxID=3364855 RepID=UPI0036A4C0DC